VTYGSGANQFSADQGYSEHQLGTTVDLTTEGVKIPLTTNFEDTPSYKWLSENAYRYGFTLSYPKNNLYYEYEPWHWRFVGVELATKLYNEKIYFSDMEQRIIDTFLVNIFD
jgi:D-alanyl-D-alanine carboxypeptidase